MLRSIVLSTMLLGGSVFAQDVPMKYCKHACVQYMMETMHNGESGVFSSSSSSMSSHSPFKSITQYCDGFISDETRCVKVVIGRGKDSNYKSLRKPFGWGYGFTKQ